MRLVLEHMNGVVSRLEQDDLDGSGTKKMLSITLAKVYMYRFVSRECDGRVECFTG